MAAFLAERYWPGLDEPTARAAVERLARHAAKQAAAVVSLLACAYVPGEQTVLVLFRAESSAVVVSLGERAALDFDRVVEAIVVPTGASPDAGRATPETAGR
jgi:hypothetical protein